MSDWMKWGADSLSYARQAAAQATTLVAGTELDKKLAEATTNEPWGASGTLMGEIARATFGYDDFKTVMATIWKNLLLTGSLWRVVYKTLNLLDYIVRNGSERVIEDCRDHMRDLKALQKFEYVDPEGKDTGINVREKAKQLHELLSNEEVLTQEREKAKANRNKFSGTSSADMGVEGAPRDPPKSTKGFSDDDFKFSAERGRKDSASTVGLGSMVSGLYSSATEYVSAASKQIQSMQTLFPSSELDRKLTDATTNDPRMPSSSLLYELGRATHRDDDYRIILSAVWQTVLRSNQRPNVVLKTLMILEAVLLHGPDRALEETIDMKTDIKALSSYSCSDFVEAGKVQQKANDIIELLEDGTRLQQRRGEAADGFGSSEKKMTGISSSDYKRDSSSDAPRDTKSPTKVPPPDADPWKVEDSGFGAAFDSLKEPEPEPAPAPPAGDLFGSFDAAPAEATSLAAPDATPAVAGLSSTIGKISIRGVEGSGRAPRATTGGVSLSKLPTPGLPTPGAVAAPPAASGGMDDLLGLMGDPTPAAPPSDPFGMAPPPAAAVMDFAAPQAATDDFGDFDSAAAPEPAPTPQSAVDSLLQNSVMGLTAAPVAAQPAPAPAPAAPMAMGAGSGLGSAGPLPPTGGPIPGFGARPAPAMGGMPPMGGMGAPMGGMPPMGGMGAPMVGPTPTPKAESPKKEPEKPDPFAGLM